MSTRKEELAAVPCLAKARLIKQLCKAGLANRISLDMPYEVDTFRLNEPIPFDTDKALLAPKETKHVSLAIAGHANVSDISEDAPINVDKVVVDLLARSVIQAMTSEKYKNYVLLRANFMYAHPSSPGYPQGQYRLVIVLKAKNQ